MASDLSDRYKALIKERYREYGMSCRFLPDGTVLTTKIDTFYPEHTQAALDRLSKHVP